MIMRTARIQPGLAKVVMLRTLMSLSLALLGSSGFASDAIAIPNPELLGANPSLAKQILTVDSTGPNTFPKELRLIVKSGAVDEIQAFYSDKIEINQIAATVDAHYKQHEMPSQRGKDFRLWRVLPQRFVIQLSTYEGDRLLIFTRMKEPGTGR